MYDRESVRLAGDKCKEFYGKVFRAYKFSQEADLNENPEPHLISLCNCSHLVVLDYLCLPFYRYERL